MVLNSFDVENFLVCWLAFCLTVTYIIFKPVCESWKSHYTSSLCWNFMRRTRNGKYYKSLAG